MKKWIKRAEVANKLGVSYNFLRQELEPSEGFPEGIPLAPKVFVFEEGEIDAWMDRKKSMSSVHVNQ